MYLFSLGENRHGVGIQNNNMLIIIVKINLAMVHYHYEQTKQTIWWYLFKGKNGMISQFEQARMSLTVINIDHYMHGSAFFETSCNLTFVVLHAVCAIRLTTCRVTVIVLGDRDCARWPCSGLFFSKFLLFETSLFSGGLHRPLGDHDTNVGFFELCLDHFQSFC